jgi:lipid-A-disaccharide synthase-like uncharacterized protein
MIVLTYLLYLVIGCAEWYLALRRTLASIKKDKITVPIIVFIENVLGLLVLSRFIKNDDWIIAVVYALGAALGSLIPLYLDKSKEKLNEKA